MITHGAVCLWKKEEKNRGSCCKICVFLISWQWLRCLWTCWASAPAMSWRLTRSWTVSTADEWHPPQLPAAVCLLSTGGSSPLRHTLIQNVTQRHIPRVSVRLPWLLLCPVFRAFSFNIFNFLKVIWQQRDHPEIVWHVTHSEINKPFKYLLRKSG